MLHKIILYNRPVLESSLWKILPHLQDFKPQDLNQFSTKYHHPYRDVATGTLLRILSFTAVMNNLSLGQKAYFFIILASQLSLIFERIMKRQLYVTEFNYFKKYQFDTLGQLEIRQISNATNKEEISFTLYSDNSNICLSCTGHTQINISINDLLAQYPLSEQFQVAVSTALNINQESQFDYSLVPIIWSHAHLHSVAKIITPDPAKKMRDFIPSKLRILHKGNLQDFHLSYFKWTSREQPFLVLYEKILAIFYDDNNWNLNIHYFRSLDLCHVAGKLNSIIRAIEYTCLSSRAELRVIEIADLNWLSKEVVEWPTFIGELKPSTYLDQQRVNKLKAELMPLHENYKNILQAFE